MITLTVEVLIHEFFLFCFNSMPFSCRKNIRNLITISSQAGFCSILYMCKLFMTFILLVLVTHFVMKFHQFSLL